MVEGHGLNAQRRPGPEPQRNLRPRSGASRGGLAQRRPGPEPQRNTKCRSETPASRPSLNEGRDQSPSETWRCRRQSRAPCTSLNEGRDQSPSETGRAILPRLPSWKPAQRRPGPEPQRNASSVCVAVDELCRSTKAGTRAPAKPGRNELSRPNLLPVRSTKAGTRAPAKPASHRRERATVARAAQRRPGPEPQRNA